jgi:uncharacterized SAM-binding protein YcdF (DUF218 family)
LQIIFDFLLQNRNVFKFNFTSFIAPKSMKRFSFKNIQILRLLRFIILLCGIFFLICVGLSLTTLPYWGYHWLGTSLAKNNDKPVSIILLGGSGMPSESNLIRSWYTASAAVAFPESRVIIVMPGNPGDSAGTPGKMKKELVIRGIDPERIGFEMKGTNTRSQAIHCAEILDPAQPVWLVTSPENMRRSVLCFRKVGFNKISGLPAFENASEADFSFRDDELGGKPTILPDVGENLQVRYQLWNHLKYEILIVREMVALTYYRLRGWT